MRFPVRRKVHRLVLLSNGLVSFPRFPPSIWNVSHAQGPDEIEFSARKPATVVTGACLLFPHLQVWAAALYLIIDIT